MEDSKLSKKQLYYINNKTRLLEYARVYNKKPENQRYCEYCFNSYCAKNFKQHVKTKIHIRNETRITQNQ